MNKPTPKTEVAIKVIHSSTHRVIFYATPDAAQEFARFGHVASMPINIDEYYLDVDARYDFDEVVEYIRNYG